MNTNSEANKEQRFQDVLEAFSTGMFVTQTSEGPVARPMRIAEVTDECEVWMVTDSESEKIDEIESNPIVALTLQGTSQYLSLTGRATVIADQAKVEELWSEPWKLWFSQGKSDPTIRLIRIDPTAGEYWDMTGSKKLQYLFEAGKAYFSGTEIDSSDLDVSGKVKL